MKDTYFFDYKDALKEAKKENKLDIFGSLQLCYYNGENKHSTLENLIWLPLDDFCEYMSETPNRMVSDVVFDKSFTKEQEIQIKSYLQQLQFIAANKKKKIGNEYRKAIKKQSPNFNEPLRILFLTTRITTVLQFVAKNLADTFTQMGYDTFISIESSPLQSWGGADIEQSPDFAWHLKNIYEYNPHIIFNLDWMNNTFLNENVFNFVWFQDPMEILYNNQKIDVRKRDYIFTLFDEFKDALIKKGVSKNKIKMQQFATNPKIFYRDSSIQKGHKIVFLGSDYSFEKNVKIPKNIEKEIYEHIENNTLTEKLVSEWAKKSNVDEKYFQTSIITSYVRRRVIVWMCSLKDIEVEVYGTDVWLQTPEVAPFYKGLLPYGEEMAKVYNGAIYGVSAHPQYRYQQRIFEMSACETIPLVYKCDLLKEKFTHEDNVLSFSTLEELKNCIGQIPKKDPKQISEDISFKKLAQKIIDIVKKETKI